MKKTFFFLAALTILSACTPHQNPPIIDPNDTIPMDTIPTDTIPEQPTFDTQFALGGDLSWLTEMEKSKKFYNADGEQMECMELLQSIGMNAVRFRVWVDPDGGWCGKEDVLVKCRRAHALGLRIMIDFHYSDWFCDPGKQTVPAAWQGLDFEGIKQKVAEHTTDILSALHDEGISVEWVQIGNETITGMLWNYGRIKDWTDTEFANFTALVNAGIDATKAIYPDAITIVHLDAAQKTSRNQSFFEKLKQTGCKFDMAGLSLYAMGDSKTPYTTYHTQAKATINGIAKSLNMKVMICEVGTKYNNAEANACMQDFVEQICSLESCAGAFYWEPECYAWWKPAIYNSLGWNSYDGGAFTPNGKPDTQLYTLYGYQKPLPQ